MAPTAARKVNSQPSIRESDQLSSEMCRDHELPPIIAPIFTVVSLLLATAQVMVAYGGLRRTLVHVGGGGAMADLSRRRRHVWRFCVHGGVLSGLVD